MTFIFWIFVSFLPGLLGRKFRPGAWYDTLPKAPWTPPKITFPIVWTLLYLLIGISAGLAFRFDLSQKRGALALFLLHLVLNPLWSWIFFGQHRVGLAFAELLVLWGVALALLVSFWTISPVAGGLLVPYLLWLTFALSLNGYIVFK